MDKPRALIVDDELNVCEALRAILDGEGIDATATTSSIDAVELVKSGVFDLVLSDLRMPELDGISLYDRIHEISPESIFIIVTAYGTIQSAVDAVKRGIYDYIQKPFTPDEVRIPVRRALERMKLERENRALRSQIEARYAFSTIIGGSEAMQEVLRIMRHAASSESNVLITGESGTGKELAARTIHANSSRSNRNFVVVNCGAIPADTLDAELFGIGTEDPASGAPERKGLLGDADRGTLFLDEIGELSVPLQVKLLRVIQDGGFVRGGDTHMTPASIRIIAATNRDLTRAISDKLFREDLFYLINVIPVKMPPLREKAEDIPLLVNHFIQQHHQSFRDKGVSSISKEALQSLMQYHFPGNIRELENSIEYAMDFTAGPVILKEDLPPYILEERRLGGKEKSIPIMPLKEAKTRLEKDLIIAALIETGGNLSEAGRLLNIHRQNLQQKISLLNIDLSSF